MTDTISQTGVLTVVNEAVMYVVSVPFQQVDTAVAESGDFTVVDFEVGVLSRNAVRGGQLVIVFMAAPFGE